jgi:hypothetical protein
VTTERKLWRCVERLDLCGFERDGDAAEVCILWVTHKISPFSSRSTPGSASVHSFETELLTQDKNLTGLAAIRRSHRFSRAKQVARYAGLDPSIVQSGKQHRQGRISKAGSPLLRTLLVEAAHSLARWDSGPLGQFYARKARQVGPRKAMIALARKLLMSDARARRTEGMMSRRRTLVPA